MLTLDQIARRACALMGIDDAGSVAQAKEFCRTRWRMLWDAELWPQPRTVAPVTLANAGDTVTLPATMSLPTQVRMTANGMVIPSDSELAAAMADPDAYRELGGETLHWTLIEPAEDGAVRLRFSRAAFRDTALTVLGKRAFTEPEDASAPNIPGADLALLAHTEADLYEWQRQNGKAQAKRAEAMALEERMRGIALEQTAHFARFVPID